MARRFLLISLPVLPGTTATPDSLEEERRILVGGKINVESLLLEVMGGLDWFVGPAVGQILLCLGQQRANIIAAVRTNPTTL